MIISYVRLKAKACVSYVLEVGVAASQLNLKATDPFLLTRCCVDDGTNLAVKKVTWAWGNKGQHIQTNHDPICLLYNTHTRPLPDQTQKKNLLWKKSVRICCNALLPPSLQKACACIYIQNNRSPQKKTHTQTKNTKKQKTRKNKKNITNHGGTYISPTTAGERTFNTQLDPGVDIRTPKAGSSEGPCPSRSEGGRAVILRTPPPDRPIYPPPLAGWVAAQPRPPRRVFPPSRPCLSRRRLR